MSRFMAQRLKTKWATKWRDPLDVRPEFGVLLLGLLESLQDGFGWLGAGKCDSVLNDKQGNRRSSQVFGFAFLGKHFGRSFIRAQQSFDAVSFKSCLFANLN